MSWKRERDLLIAQTMAFVQSVTGKAAEADGRAEPAPLSEAAKISPPRVVLVPSQPSQLKHGDLREEVQRRVAAFRARQQLFHRERDEYCNATLAKARAITEQAAKAPASQPPKR
jgi:hypothetical protein